MFTAGAVIIVILIVLWVMKNQGPQGAAPKATARILFGAEKTKETTIVVAKTAKVLADEGVAKVKAEAPKHINNAKTKKAAAVKAAKVGWKSYLHDTKVNVDRMRQEAKGNKQDQA